MTDRPRLETFAPVALGILIGTAVFEVASLPPLTSATCGGGLCVAMEFGAIEEGKLGATYYYTTSIQAVPNEMVATDLNFQVLSHDGRFVPVIGTMTVQSSAGVGAAAYNMTTGQWTTGGMFGLVSGQRLQLTLTVPTTGISGDFLTVSGTGPYRGEVSLCIP